MPTIKDSLSKVEVRDAVMDGLLLMIHLLETSHPDLDGAVLRTLIVEALGNVTLDTTGVSVTIQDYQSSILK